jgi:hypothetical protein
VVLNATTKEVLTVCGYEERSLSGQAKQTFTFALLPNASVGVVRGMVAEKLSAASVCVHLQVLMRESNGCEPVTCGSVADELDESNPATSMLAFVYTTESRHSCFYVYRIACGGLSDGEDRLTRLPACASAQGERRWCSSVSQYVARDMIICVETAPLQRWLRTRIFFPLLCQYLWSPAEELLLSDVYERSERGRHVIDVVNLFSLLLRP